MLSKKANSFTKNDYLKLKVRCFKINFVHALPSPLLAPEGILDEIFPSFNYLQWDSKEREVK